MRQKKANANFPKSLKHCIMQSGPKSEQKYFFSLLAALKRASMSDNLILLLLKLHFLPIPSYNQILLIFVHCAAVGRSPLWGLKMVLKAIKEAGQRVRSGRRSRQGCNCGEGGKQQLRESPQRRRSGRRSAHGRRRGKSTRWLATAALRGLCSH